jgi:hypothetical protein
LVARKKPLLYSLSAEFKKNRKSSFFTHCQEVVTPFGSVQRYLIMREVYHGSDKSSREKKGYLMKSEKGSWIKKPHYRTPSDIYEWGLRLSGQAVYTCLCKMANNETGESIVGKKTIAEYSKIGVTMVYYALKELEAKGLVKIEPRYEDGHQKANLYTVYDSLGGAFQQQNETLGANKRTDVAPIQQVNPYPFTERTPTHSRGEHRTRLNELDSFNYSEGATPGGDAAAPTQKKLTFGDEFEKVKLHQGEYDQLVALFTDAVVKDYINRLDMHIAHTNKRYPSHYATIYKWITEDTRKDGGVNRKKTQSNTNRFANFKQRDVDYNQYEKLEREHLEREFNLLREDKP